MSLYPFPALVTGLALLVYLGTIALCARARGRYAIKAPAVTGHPLFERAFRIQQNTAEQLLLFLPSLWLCAATLSPLWAGIVGLVFVAARLLYAVSYARDPASRGPGFTVGFAASVLLLLGGLVGAVRLLLGGSA